MNAPQAQAIEGGALRRGACPGLTAPMPTGDGLLVRLTPSGVTMTLPAVASLSAAARRHGNGIIEVTARGNIQVRGLTAVTADAFAQDVAALEIAAPDGVPVLADPLAGLEPAHSLDTAALAAALRARLAASQWASPLSPKLSVVIDGGAELHLDAVAADIRLVSADRAGFHMGLGGDAASAVPLGLVSADDAIEAVMHLVAAIARRGPRARASDVLRAGDLDTLRDALAGLVSEAPAPPPRPKSNPIGPHPLRDGGMALGIGLAFGHTDAATLDLLIEACTRAGVAGLRTAPGRALLLLLPAVTDTTTPTPDPSPPSGRLRPSSTGYGGGELRDACDRLGFIIRRDDPRRRVVACAGAPICGSAHIAARALAPAVAAGIAPHVDGLIHLSGCAKGCAHPGRAALTIVGTACGCGVVVNGTAREAPVGMIQADDLPDGLAAFMAQAGAPSHD